MCNNASDNSVFWFYKVDIFRADHCINRLLLTESFIDTRKVGAEDIDEPVMYHRGGKNVTVTDKVCNERILRFIINIFRCSYLLDISLVHNDDRIGHSQGFLLIMSDVNKCNAKLIF